RHTRFSRDWSSDVCSSDLDPIGGVEFRILRIEAAPYPEFSEEMTYRTISPICISFRSLMDKQPKYLHPDDGRYRDLMIANLVRKIGRASCRERVSIAGGAG